MALIVGLWPMWTALVLVGFMAVTTWTTYRFGMFTAVFRQPQPVPLMKNLAVMAGLLFYCGERTRSLEPNRIAESLKAVAWRVGLSAAARAFDHAVDIFCRLLRTPSWGCARASSLLNGGQSWPLPLLPRSIVPSGGGTLEAGGGLVIGGRVSALAHQIAKQNVLKFTLT